MDRALGLSASAGEVLANARTGKNGRYALAGLLRQPVFGRLAGYGEVNDTGRWCCVPAMCWVVGDRAPQGAAATASEMGRSETQWLTRPKNLAASTDLSGQRINRVHSRRPPKVIILDMDSSESPTHGEQEGSAYNGRFGCTCYHPLLYRGIGCQAPSSLFVSLHGGLASLRGRRCGRHIMGSEGRGRTICSTD